MLNKKIKYVAFYSYQSLENENRIHSLSATNKIDYICSVLNRNGFDVEIISPSWTNHKNGYYKGKTITIDNNTTLKIFSTFGVSNWRVLRIIKYFWSLFQLTVYLLFQLNRGEKLLVYHSTILSTPLRFVKKIKRFQLILEVEEIYANIIPSKIFDKQENEIIKAADKYMFSTEMLNAKLNQKGKPYSVIYGTYRLEQDRKVRFNDYRIHAVYGGIIDSQKGGATAAAAAATYLDSHYHIHIIGFGQELDVKKLHELIEEIALTTECTLTYDGLLPREGYIQLLQKCQIGLCTQTPDAALNETSFPSKILSYMANGLRVVSIRMNAVEISKIGTEVFFYDKHDPKAIAEAIKAINLSETYNGRKLIMELDNQFVREIQVLLQDG